MKKRITIIAIISILLIVFFSSRVLATYDNTTGEVNNVTHLETILPSTGGIGIVWFVIAGAAIAVLAVVLKKYTK